MRPYNEVVIGKTARGSPSASPWLSCHDAAFACLVFSPAPAASRRPPGEFFTSAADAEALDQRLVARLVDALDIVEQRAALRDHLQQAATGVVVLHVGLEVLGEVRDALGEDRDLDFRRAGVADLEGVIANELQPCARQ